jgi:hypothetical protein
LGLFHATQEKIAIKGSTAQCIARQESLYVVPDVVFAVFGLNNIEERAIQTLDYIMFKEDIKVFRD